MKLFQININFNLNRTSYYIVWYSIHENKMFILTIVYVLHVVLYAVWGKEAFTILMIGILSHITFIFIFLALRKTVIASFYGPLFAWFLGRQGKTSKKKVFFVHKYCQVIYRRTCIKWRGYLLSSAFFMSHAKLLVERALVPPFCFLSTFKLAFGPGNYYETYIDSKWIVQGLLLFATCVGPSGSWPISYLPYREDSSQVYTRNEIRRSAKTAFSMQPIRNCFTSYM